MACYNNTRASTPVFRHLLLATPALFALWGCTPEPAIQTSAESVATARIDNGSTHVADTPSTKNQALARATGLRPSYDKCIDAANGETPAMHACIDTEYRFQDDRLNGAYAALLARSNEKDVDRLREAQRSWIADRNDRCAYDAESGQAGAIDAHTCRLEMTAAKADELESP